MDKSPHKSDFINVNGVRLHYLDWGRSGDVILFLAGMGCNAHIFDNLAPRFADNFHVMALTRRGHGESDQPETGYDINTLTDDIRQFMDATGIEKAILVGHSLAHIELSHFTALYPERVLKLVFLDAAYDRSSDSFKNMLEKNPLIKMQKPGQDEAYYTIDDYFASIKRDYPALAVIWDDLMQEHSLHEITQTADGKIIDKMSDATGAALNKTLSSYVPEDSKIKNPVLGIFAILNGGYYIADDWMTAEQKAQVWEFFEKVNDPWIRENIDQFQQNMPQAQVVVIPQGHHYCFIKEEELVYDEMRKFLTG
jgi:pimeloyl-ACP methyl ester carboxylesterase